MIGRDAPVRTGAQAQPRHLRSAVAALAITFAVPLAGCAMDACPAIGYVYDAPAVLRFDPDLPEASAVAACFGIDCEPADVTQGASGEWEVPQEPPFTPDLAPGGSVRDLRVVVEAGGAVLTGATHTIPVTMQAEGVFGQCPGPFVFDPVDIEW